MSKTIDIYDNIYFIEKYAKNFSLISRLDRNNNKDHINIFEKGGERRRL